MVRHWVRMPGGLSGDRQDVVRGSIWCAGACAVISGVIVSPAVIYRLRIGCVNSFTFVGSGSGSGGGGSGGGGCDDMRRRYGATICTTDMVRRYGEPICKAGKQKRPRTCCSWPLMLFAFVIRYFCFLIHLSIFPISVGTIPAIKSWSCTSPMCETSVSHS